MTAPSTTQRRTFGERARRKRLPQITGLVAFCGPINLIKLPGVGLSNYLASGSK
jgi:hypothetical protein